MLDVLIEKTEKLIGEECAFAARSRKRARSGVRQWGLVMVLLFSSQLSCLFGTPDSYTIFIACMNTVVGGLSTASWLYFRRRYLAIASSMDEQVVELIELRDAMKARLKEERGF